MELVLARKRIRNPTRTDCACVCVRVVTSNTLLKTHIEIYLLIALKSNRHLKRQEGEEGHEGEEEQEQQLLANAYSKGVRCKRGAHVQQAQSAHVTKYLRFLQTCSHSAARQEPKQTWQPSIFIQRSRVAVEVCVCVCVCLENIE